MHQRDLLRAMARVRPPHPGIATRKARADLLLAAVIGVLLLIMNLSINFIGTVHVFFRDYSQFALMVTIVNLTTAWLALLLFVAFYRWLKASRSNAELEQIVSCISPDTLIVVRPDRTITMCNASVERMFGRRASDVIGHTTDILYKDRREQHVGACEIRDALSNEGFHIGSATGVRASGEEFPLEIVLGHLELDHGAVVLLRDISERKREEDERIQLEQQVAQRQRMESLGLLAGGIAHDFNNLLAGILGNADLVLADMPESAPYRDNCDEIVRSANRAAVLCREMLAYSGRGRIQIEALQINDIIDEMKQFFEIAAPEGTTITYALAGETPPIEGDLPQVRQILMNLVTNAADAFNGSSGALEISTGCMSCDEPFLSRCRFREASRPGTYAYLRVSDDGCGMDQDTQSKIFDPFFTTKFTGHGLGLACVQGIIRSHKGALDLTSRPGHGTVFTAFFPATEKTVIPRLPPSEDDGWRGQGTVLVVDNEPAVVKLASRMITRLGFDPVCADGGQTAIELYRTRHSDLQLVLLDLSMPSISGHEVFLEMQRMDDTVPIILSSGYTHEDVASLFTNHSPAGFIQKPYQLNTLRGAVRQALQGP
ncbi:MAG: ATP-binding protein [Verrucomicrobia bacterium]|nr:ATP-binding protein [Verrucomicrobiota bacterium]MDA1086907.1 ATP-binding protein [Verrucomicrobiota bacterium]